MQSTIEATMQTRDGLTEQVLFQQGRSRGADVFEMEDPGPNGKALSCYKYMYVSIYLCGGVEWRSAEEVVSLSFAVI
jgi:hypothetical protein